MCTFYDREKIVVSGDCVPFVVKCKYLLAKMINKGAVKEFHRIEALKLRKKSEIHASLRPP